MIHVLCAPSERRAAEEFFELFKVPWRFYDETEVTDGSVLLASAPIDLVDLAEFSVALLFSSSALVVDDEIEYDESEPACRQIPPLSGGALSLGTFASSSGTVRSLKPDGCDAFALIGKVGATRVIRCGYDLFAEVAALLGPGQPPESAAIPTLDLHVELVRQWIVRAGIPLVEIAPVRAGHPFAVCLTHDVDFLDIRRHMVDRSLLGFVWRASVGTLLEALAGRASLRRLIRNWLAVISLPLVYLKVVRDPWRPFDSYLAADPAPATYFVIPYRNRPGERLGDRPDRGRRAVKYDVSELGAALDKLKEAGCEVALHGIDAWHSEEAGRAELARIAASTGEERCGVRMHWLCFDDSYGVLESAGFDYDATCGFNEAVGFKAGTTQVFRPLESERLLELPLHVQDTALFFPARMSLSDSEAWERVAAVRSAVAQSGGVLTVSWHDRSLGPERLWDRFYRRLIKAAEADGAWFGTAQQIVDWFRLRRSIRFNSVEVSDGSMTVSLSAPTDVAEAAFVIRVHVSTEHGSRSFDTPWQGEEIVNLRVSTPRPVGAG